MRGRRTLLIWLALGVVIIVALILLWQGLRGQGFRMLATHRVKALLDRTPAQQRGDFTNVIFLHHSTGRNLINQGGVRERLTAAGFQFWDHDYNWEGLIRPDGTRTGYSYGIPDDNTDPDGLARLFAQHIYPWPLNALSGLMQHEVIAFKSCFPASNITSQEQLQQYKTWYLGMREVMDRYPDHVFIVITPPPLNPAATDAETAARARAFANWLKSDEFLAGHPNVFTFDFFDLLAEGDPSVPDFNMLRAEYREGEDSHPNKLANQTVGPLFADFIVEAVQTYRARLAGGGKTP
ncbi:MAG: hypothetical protein NUW24_02930 [Anaerolineae bacterium]|nr:hypothetical protein [Anaerolineae bacterium]MDH7473310.1 hypothetical protein [Anaerolineae bacterium]